jgi:hypothetical protein
VCIEAPKAVADISNYGHTPVDLAWVAQALRNILDDHDPHVLCSRMSCLPSHVEQLARSVASASHLLDPLTARKLREPLLHGADPAMCVMWIRQVLSIHKLRFDFDKLELLPALMKFSSTQTNSALVADAANAWQLSKRGQAISLGQPQAIAPIVKLLLAARVPASSLIARMQVDSQDIARRQADIDRFVADWINVFGTEITVETVAPRRGYPKSYLMVLNRPCAGSSTAHPASLPMHGVHGFFFCLSALQQFNLPRVSA